MARDYAKKLEAMRAYAKSPEAKAKRKAYLKRVRATRDEGRADTWKVNPAPLVNAIGSWR